MTHARRQLLRLAAASPFLGLPAAARSQLRAASGQEQAADAAAFADVAKGLAEQWTDVESAVVLLQGRPAFAWYRDGAPDRLRNVQSVEKSALAALVGVALGRGELRSLDEPVLALVPEWAPLNADPRTREITVRHLLAMTAGFDLGSATSISGKLPPAQGWARPLATAPGQRYAYDNAMVTLVAALLEKVTGQALPAYARAHLVEPLGLAEPQYPQLHLRTLDMARLGQLFLQEGRWGERQLLPADFAAAATRAQSSGGPPANLPYGLFWWVPPGDGGRRAYLASGYAGQMIWVLPPFGMVVAITSVISADSQRRGHAFQLLQRGLLPAASQVARP